MGNIIYSLWKQNIMHRTQDIYHFVIWCILCQLGPFLLVQSHITTKQLPLYQLTTKIQMCYETKLLEMARFNVPSSATSG